MDWHFLTIGIGSKNFERAAERLTREANKSMTFKTLNTETNKSLNLNHADFLRAHSQFISENSAIGFGNYLWKPYLVNYWLNKIPEGDGLLYLDAGCTLNLRNQAARRKWRDYFNSASQYGSLCTQLKNGEFGINDLSERSWTNPELIRTLNLSESDSKSNQIQSGILFLINKSQNRRVLEQWWELSTIDNYSFLKTGEFVSEEGLIRCNRWEQSILSCLAKKYTWNAIPDETYFYPDWRKRGAGFPIWATRNRSGISVGAFSVRDIPAHLYRLTNRIKRKLIS